MANVIGKNADMMLSKLAVGAEIPVSSTDPLYDGAPLDADNRRIETLENEITLNIESNTDEDTAYGDSWEKHEVITGRWSVDITAYYSTASDEIDELFVNQFFEAITAAPGAHTGKQRMAFWPNGVPTGGVTEASPTQPKYLGACVLAQSTIDPVRTGVSRLRARLMGHGDLFRSIVT